MSTEVEERVNRLIWKGLGVKSVREIANETGLEPQEVLRRRDEILNSVDVLTVQQSRQKLVVTLREIAQQVQDDYDSAPYEFKAGLMNSAIAAIKANLVELTRADKADNEKITHLNQLRIRELVELMQEIVDVSVAEVAEKYGIDEDELFDIFNKNLKAAGQKREAIE